MNLERHIEYFFRLISKPSIKEFLITDGCCAIVDKYILAGILIYFLRANFEAEDYTTRNFYVALYLCHDIHEEVDIFKHRIIEKCLGTCIENLGCRHRFNADRIHLMKKIDFQADFSKRCCEIIFSRYPHEIWYRNRRENHSGMFINEDAFCNTCSLPIVQ